MITQLTPEQEALIPVYLEKWRGIALFTEPIDHQKAAEAVKAAYRLIGKEEPKVIFHDSPCTAFNELWNKLGDKLWESQLRDLDELWKLLYKQLGNQLNKNLWEELENQLYGQLDRPIFQLTYGLSEQLDIDNINGYGCPEVWAGNSSLIDFCISGLNCECDQRRWTVLNFLIENCGWIFPYEKVCYVCERPRILSFDNQQRLHAEGSPAIQFADGFSVYAYHGVRLPEKYGKVYQNQWQSEWLLSETNAELRRVLIQGIGYARICQELQAVELDSWQEYTLLKINSDVDVEPIYLLKMSCPSTGYIHALRVPPDVKSAREAITWVNWGINPEQFSVQT